MQTTPSNSHSGAHSGSLPVLQSDPQSASQALGLPSQIRRLVERVERRPGTLTPDELASIVREANVRLADVMHAATESDERYTRNTLYESDRVAVVLLVWKPGQASPVHNHAGSRCAVQVLGGIASETAFELDASGTPVPVAFDRHQTGETFSGADEDIHVVANLEEETLYTLHVYTPPLRNMRVWKDEEAPAGGAPVATNATGAAADDAIDADGATGVDGATDTADTAGATDADATAATVASTGSEETAAPRADATSELPSLSPEAFRRRWETVDFPIDATGRYRPEWLGRTMGPGGAPGAALGREPDRRDRVSRRLRGRGGAMGRTLGALLDRYVTLVSGIAPSDGSPWMLWTRPRLYAVVLLWLFGGAAASMAILASGQLLLLPLLAITLLVTASGARAGMLTIMHDAIHMWLEHPDPRVRQLFWWIGTVMSTLLFVEDFPTYAEKHHRHHLEKKFATNADPDVRLIRSLGFEPGMEVDELWAHFRRMRWSPWFHWTYFKARLIAQLGRGPVAQRAAVGLLWSGVLALVAISGLWLPFLIGWVFPVVFMFQRAALEQFLGEHRWLRQHDPEDAAQVVYAESSAGRFALAEPPDAALPPVDRAIGWMMWFLDLQLVQALYRPTIVFGDLAHHDEHHVHGLATLHERGVPLPVYAQPEIAWMNTAYGRRVYQSLRTEGDPVLSEFWNRRDPLQATFEVLSEIDPAMVAAPSDEAGTANGMLGM
ncbi:MAG TPA: hypothetical protein PKC43_05900 [Phycisphaerales bacterium]|nr:hypothetical protein [Phycisphaerales bacterium]HMP36966.1 hypothetical protein [Phycisphaerales bacterium]